MAPAAVVVSCGLAGIVLLIQPVHVLPVLTLLGGAFAGGTVNLLFDSGMPTPKVWQVEAAWAVAGMAVARLLLHVNRVTKPPRPTNDSPPPPEGDSP